MLHQKNAILIAPNFLSHRGVRAGETRVFVRRSRPAGWDYGVGLRADLPGSDKNLSRFIFSS